jgi:hypothetical protein
MPQAAAPTENELMPAPTTIVSVIEPLTPAFERVKTVLFQPFDFSKWLVIGFSAWLAQLGHSHHGGASFRGGPGAGAQVRPAIENAVDYILANLHWIIPVAIGVGLLILAVWLVLTWLSSRGQFMFLHAVATNRAEAALPWSRFAAHGNSLFIFRAILGLATFTLILPLVIALFLNIALLTSPEGRVVFPVFRMVMTIAAVAGIALVYSLIQKLTFDFVVPIMFLRTDSWTDGWRRFLSLLADNTLSFLLYILFSIVLALVIGVIIFGVVIATCCLAGCLMAIPYVGTVLLLPIHVFRRSYSLYYLSQFGPDFNVFTQAITLPPSPEPS